MVEFDILTLRQKHRVCQSSLDAKISFFEILDRITKLCFAAS